MSFYYPEKSPIKQNSSHLVANQKFEEKLDRCYSSISFYLFLPVLFFFSAKVSGADIDTALIIHDLPELEVSAFETFRPALIQPVSIEQITGEDFLALGNRSLSEVVNSRAGITLEERAPASYRISIRGSSLRAPFGVRNVKIYWNDLPFTLSDGSTPLNLIDLRSIESMEILKGPAGSIYGSGNGGILKLRTLSLKKADGIRAYFQTGSWNNIHTGLQWGQTVNNGEIHLGFDHYSSDGFRDHSSVQRSSLNLSARLFPMADSPISFHLLYTDLQYQIPGGLTLDQLSENPRQARPGSAEQNSSIHQKTLLTGLTAEYSLSENWINRTAAYLTTTDFDHPFILDYKTELSTDMGGRTVFQWDSKWRDMPIRLILGGEYQRGRNSAGNFGNMAGVRDTIRFLDDITTEQWLLFQQIEIEPADGWLIAASLSQNQISYKLDRKVDALNQMPLTLARTFRMEWVPRLSVSKKLGDHSAVFASLSAGFSPPTLDEFRTNEGSLNRDLEAEKGLNTELGFKRYAADESFILEASLFYFRLSETITTFTNEDGVVLFRNSGGTNHYGLEVSLSYDVYKSDAGRGFSVSARHSYTGHHFLFADYEARGEDLSGNRLTGVAPHSLNNMLQFDLGGEFSLFLRHQYSDRIPLNDQNTVFQASRNLFSAKASWNPRFAGYLNFSFGLENITDQIYGLGNDLNAFGGRFYQPSPGRHWNAGLSLSLE